MRHAALFALVCCTILSLSSRADTTTFNKDVAPILFKNCTGCHRPGEVAPFTLINYKDAQKRSAQIMRVTGRHFMPPWKAEVGYGDFADPRVLTQAEIATLKKWHEEGAIEGKASDLPSLPKYSSDWQLGKPDMIVTMPDEYTVAAEGKDIYRCFVIPLKNDKELNISAVEYRPGNRAVVHHALLFLDNTGQAMKRDKADPAPGYKSGGGVGFVPYGGLGGWAPGLYPRAYPDGVAAVVQKNSDLVIQMHFHPSGKEEKEKSSVALYFAKKPTTRILIGSGLTSVNVDIPAGEKNYKTTAAVTLPVDTEWVSVTPHAHLLCKEIKADYILPDGKKNPLVWIKDWDFDWQDQYQFKKPLMLPKGTKIEMEFTYDNSAENERNPSTPPKRVKLGEQTTDEMALLFMNAAVKNQDDGRALVASMFGQSAISSLPGGKDLQDTAAKILSLPPDQQEKAARDLFKKFRDEQKKKTE